MSMAENIYPGSARENCFANIYCEIAMESYYNATASYKQIKEAEYSWDYYGEYDSMNKSVVSTIVFQQWQSRHLSMIMQQHAWEI